MPLLEEVDEGSGAGASPAEKLKNEHRRKRAKGRKKKKPVKDSPYSWSILGVVVLATALVVVGLWSRASALSRDTNSCKMTFSRPMYVPLAVPGYPFVAGEVGDDTPSGYGYLLMRYLDRKLPEEERVDPSKPTGFPVLFVPGHVGSHEQARSLSSQASEAEVTTSRRRLDIFALDLLEEWTAVHGSLVWRQAEFLNHAVETILALYADCSSRNDGPSINSVMIVGHSMGGLVARAAFTLPSYRVGSISDIITLGTPHNRAPWMVDYSVFGLYRCTDSLWRWHSSLPSISGFSHCWVRPKPATSKIPLSTSIPADEGYKNAKEMETLEHDNEASRDSGIKLEGSCLESDGSDAASEDCTARPMTLAAGANAGPDPSDGEMFKDETDGQRVPQGHKDGGSVMRQRNTFGMTADALIGDTVLLSVSGGPKDMMVHPSLCVTDGLGVPGQSVAFTTGAMDACGFGVDHLALLWCKQLVNRIVATLSELEKLHGQGAGARERTRVAATSIASLPSALSRDSSDTSEEDMPMSAGFKEASQAGAGWQMVARSLVTDRVQLLIPAWVCMACLVLAAALIRGLSSKNTKERALPPLFLLLTPEEHFQWRGIKHAGFSLWASARSYGAPAVVALVTSFGVLLVYAFGEEVLRLVPGGVERVLDVLLSVPGGSGAVAVAMFAFRIVDAAVRFLNPFEGAEDALRLPNKAIVALYFASLGWIMVFVSLVSLLGAIGSGCRRISSPAPASLLACLRLLRSRKVAVVMTSVALLLVHMEKFAAPPKLRPITLTGELSLLLVVLSLSLYGLLISLAMFPATSPGVATHQRLLLLLYAPAPAVLIGPQVAAVQLLLGRGGPHESFVGWGEMGLASTAVLPIISSVWFARRARSFPSPPSIRGFLMDLRRRMEEEVARSNGGVSAGQGAYGTRQKGAMELEYSEEHGACTACLHADGGYGAVYVETEMQLVYVGGGVTVGPGFRVVACDCPRREPASPSSWCEFCRCVCEICGGSREAVRLMRGSRVFGGRAEEMVASEELRATSVVGLVSAAVLYLGLWAFGMRLMSEPCYALVAMSGMGAMVCSLHWGLAKDAGNTLKRS